MKIEDYASQLLQEVLAATDADEEYGSRPEAFTAVVASRMTDAGYFDDFEVAFERKKKWGVSGYAIGEDDASIHLAITDFHSKEKIESLTSSQVEDCFLHLISFVEKSFSGLSGQLEESSPVFELAELLRESRQSLESLHLYVFTNARTRRPRVPITRVSGILTECQVWDLERLYQLDTSGIEHEPIVVDVIERLGYPLPCLRESHPSSGHTVYVAIFPGEFVADLYLDYEARLLERNVRAFLQARGAVNKGMRETLQFSPDRFMAYNNGISATATRVELTVESDGVFAINRICDLQIVNGGQTTASLAAAKKRDKVDLSKVSVQCKLTEVDPGLMDELVPRISKYSNTQNKVTGADFSANHKFHVEVEHLSRSIWAPDADGTQRQTHWYYERVRGQYATDCAKEGTQARQRQFQVINPKCQKFTKTDLAKFENAWSQEPHTVSLGAEKNFREFMLRLDERPIDATPEYFERLVAKAVLFRSTEKIVTGQQFGGYRANLVAYTVAKLSNGVAQRLDLASIWRHQDLSAETKAAIAEIAQLVAGVITNPPTRFRNVSEWSKKIECWKLVEEIPWTPSGELNQELVALKQGVIEIVKSERHAIKLASSQDLDVIRQVSEVDPDTWFQIANWAKVTGNLRPWQRGLAYSLGRLAQRGQSPSIRQARQGLILLDEVGSLGFRN